MFSALIAWRLAEIKGGSVGVGRTSRIVAVGVSTTVVGVLNLGVDVLVAGSRLSSGVLTSIVGV